MVIGHTGKKRKGGIILQYLAFILISFVCWIETASSSYQDHDYERGRNSFLPQNLSQEDWDSIYELTHNAQTIQTYALQKFNNPSYAPSQDFLNLAPGLQYGAKEAVKFLNELMGIHPTEESDHELLDSDSVDEMSSSSSLEAENEKPEKEMDSNSSRLSSEDSDLESDLDDILNQALEEIFSTEKISNESSLSDHAELQFVDLRSPRKEYKENIIIKGARSRSLSPERLRDTYYEDGADFVQSTIEGMYQERENLKKCGFTYDCLQRSSLGKITGAYALDLVSDVTDIADMVTFGAFSKVSEGLDYLADSARTGVRRSVRYITQDQRLGQNLGDYAYLALATMGTGKLKGPISFVKNPRVKKINNRKPVNAEYANRVYPIEKLPEELRGIYPHSVPFTGTGHPDFSRYAVKKVKIKMTGYRYKDNKLANKAAGYANTPEGYTWHHHHDGESMYLVPLKLHNAVDHTGGVAIVKSKKKGHNDIN